MWYAPVGEKDIFSWYRSNDFDHVAAEVKAVRDSVGLIEISSFANYTITGAGAQNWLDRMLACKIPPEGRMTLAPMLKDDGKVIGDFTLANLGQNGFFIAGSGLAEDYHMRWFESHLPDDVSVTIVPHGAGMTGVSIAGPNARKVLASVAGESVEPDDFKFMAIKEMTIAMAPALVGRVSFTGDLGYEIWCKPEYLNHIFDELMAAGKDYDIRLFGSRALNALRLEKSYGSWASEYRPIYDPFECGLDRFVAADKPVDFIGKTALQSSRQNRKMSLRTFIVDVENADPVSDEPIYHNGEVKGWVSSGGLAHGSGVSVALGYVPAEIADEAAGWEIELIGERRNARLQTTALLDPDNIKIRS